MADAILFLFYFISYISFQYFPSIIKKQKSSLLRPMCLKHEVSNPHSCVNCRPHDVRQYRDTANSHNVVNSNGVKLISLITMNISRKRHK